jgi:hypothetical protein
VTIPFNPSDPSFGAPGSVGQQEWQGFLQRHKQLLDMILNEGTNLTHQAAADSLHAQITQQPQMQAPVMDFEPFGPPRPAGADELIAQAHAWGIPNPEKMDLAELQHHIQQMRNEIPRDEQTSLGSAALATLGLASEAGGATSRIIGNLFGDVKELPFVGPTLASILGSEKAKYWMYDLSQKTAEFTEMARAAQPAQDKGAFEVMAASGKVAGNALPALLLWNAIGAAGGVVPSAWAGRVTSPFLRAALQGGLTGGLMEAGSDEPTGSKVFNIGLGFALGGSTAVPYLGASLGLGLVGAGVGSQVGDTPEERQRHAIEGAVFGAALGVAPLAIAAAFKVKSDIPGPMDREVANLVRERPLGEDPQVLTQRATARITQQQLPAGPDYEFHTAEPQQAQTRLLVRSEPSTGEPQIIEEPQTQTPRPLPAPEQPRGLLPPRTAPTALRGTKVVDESGFPLTVFHGTGLDFESFDISKSDPEAMFGPGFYHTENPDVAAGYAGAGTVGLGQATGDQPNIRPARLNIQNPFEAERQMTFDEVSELIDRLSFAAPGYQWEDAKAILQPWMVGQPQEGRTIYNSLAQTLPKDPVQGPNQNSGDWLQRAYHAGAPTGPTGPEVSVIGKAGLNSALERLGYDGITHEGGSITGGVSHRVWIAFRPDQVHSPWDMTPLDMNGAVAQGDALTKQATLMESADLPTAVGTAKLGDSDVVEAAYGSNPAGISIIRGLNTPLGRVELQRLIGNKELHLIDHPDGTADALVGDVTPDIISDYKNYGIFKGQRVVTGAGIEAEITGFRGGKVLLRRSGGGPPLVSRPEKLLPSRFSAPVRDAPQLWESFKSDLLNYMNEEARKAQMPPVAGIWDQRVGSLLSERASDFMDRNGIYEPGLRQALG